MARRDYFYDPDAPKPNSIRPAAAVALFDSGGNILLLRRKDNDKWSMPGGTLDFGETLTYCAIREVREETGLRIRITGLIGTYTDPNILIAYSDGEVRQEFTFLYAAEIESGELKIDDESKEAAWVPLSSAVKLSLAESQIRRLKDVMEYQKEQRTFLRCPVSEFVFLVNIQQSIMHPICEVSRTTLYNMVFFLLFVVVGAIFIAIFRVRHRVSPEPSNKLIEFFQAA